jgi:hypothetical protein
MKFITKISFFDNLYREINNSPALSIIVWILFITLTLTNYTGIIDLIFLTIGFVFLFLDIKNYRRKY